MSNLLGRIKKGIDEPSKFGAWITYKLSPVLPDKIYLTLLLYFKCGIWIDWKNPKTFNEKLQWLKLYNRKPEYTIMADKVKAKEWVAARIGEEYIIPTLGVWDDPDDIDFDALPNQFVLKCNHNSGTGMYICKDKSKMDVEAVKKGLRKGLKENYFLHGREWPYKNIPRKILAEKYMEDIDGELRDYKVMCFNGKPKLIQIHIGRFKGVHTQDFYSCNWEKLANINQKGCVNSNMVFPKPLCLEKMLDLSSKLSEGLPQIRVDWYIIESDVYFGEMTFFDANGFDDFTPERINEVIGNWIELPNENH